MLLQSLGTESEYTCYLDVRAEPFLITTTSSKIILDSHRKFVNSQTCSESLTDIGPGVFDLRISFWFYSIQRVHCDAKVKMSLKLILNRNLENIRKIDE